MVVYNVQSNGPCNQLVIELINDSIFIEPNAIAYVTGNINFDAQAETFSNRFQAKFVGKKYFKPKFQGTGKIYLKATLGSYHKFSLKDDEELLLGPNAFIACRDSIQVSPQLNISAKNFFSGVPMVNLLVKGNGNVMILMPGPVQECILTDDKFVVFGEDIAAYSTKLKVTKEIFGKSWPNVQKMAKVFRGTGSIFFTPIPNKDSKVM